RPAGRRGKEEPKTVLTYYYELPLKALPVVESYLTVKNAEDARVQYSDSKDMRSTFLRTHDVTRGYAHLQRAGETKYQRLQMLNTGDGQLLMAVETSDCGRYCTGNDFKIYRKDTAWIDVTSEYLPELDRNAVLKILKSSYKDQFLDMEEYTARNYEEGDNLRKGLIYMISPDGNKIIVYEQYLPLHLYEYTWNAEKSRFDVNKLCR
ncbi:MAG: hypothetical protein M3Q97_01455, partial [Bacteroidota bacterium]|nr:hypothetical protein [Bacteroidota bacterium]